MRGWVGLGAALAAIAAAMRVNNGVRYPHLFGFDAIQNWRYVELLTGSWALPAPDADWSTAHPPLFYYAAAALVRALGEASPEASVVAVRLAGSLVGLVPAALAAALAWRASRDGLRALLAAGLVLYLPAHLYMSAMLSEEVWVASLASLALFALAWPLAKEGSAEIAPAAALAAGALAGLAWLTKLSGLLAVGAVGLVCLLDGARAGGPGWKAALRNAALVGLAALAAGGWYYLRSWWLYGYFYPHALEAHAVMQVMPPGARGLFDYLYVPLSTWSDPSVIQPDLLRSVWGGSFVTWWFDGHRKFLPLESVAATRVGTALLLLALVPAAAGALGLARGARAALRGSRIDALFVACAIASLLGYVLFTWRNPQFATVKASFLLGTALPYAHYTSGVLAGWLRAPGWRGAITAAALIVLWGLVIAAFTWGLLFAKSEFSGVIWTPIAPR